jgi:hypothetical protein
LVNRSYSYYGKLFLGYPVLYNRDFKGYFDISYQNMLFSVFDYSKAINFRTSYRLYKNDLEFNNKASIGVFWEKMFAIGPSINLNSFIGTQYNYTWKLLQNKNHGYSIIAGSSLRFNQRIETYFQIELERLNDRFLFCTTIGIAKQFYKKV